MHHIKFMHQVVYQAIRICLKAFIMYYQLIVEKYDLCQAAIQSLQAQILFRHLLMCGNDLQAKTDMKSVRRSSAALNYLTKVG